jgi:hypothetical protein
MPNASEAAYQPTKDGQPFQVFAVQKERHVGGERGGQVAQYLQFIKLHAGESELMWLTGCAGMSIALTGAAPSTLSLKAAKILALSDFFRPRAFIQVLSCSSLSMESC